MSRNGRKRQHIGDPGRGEDGGSGIVLGRAIIRIQRHMDGSSSSSSVVFMIGNQVDKQLIQSTRMLRSNSIANHIAVWSESRIGQTVRANAGSIKCRGGRTRGWAGRSRWAGWR